MRFWDWNQVGWGSGEDVGVDFLWMIGRRWISLLIYDRLGDLEIKGDVGQARQFK